MGRQEVVGIKLVRDVTVGGNRAVGGLYGTTSGLNALPRLHSRAISASLTEYKGRSTGI